MTPKTPPASDELLAMAAHACLVAKDAAVNLQELMANSSRLASLTIRQCERELDDLERRAHQALPAAITRVNETRARELLVCGAFIGNLERISDLLFWVSQRLVVPSHRVPAATRKILADMLHVLVGMLEKAHGGLLGRDSELAFAVLRLDAELDRMRSSAFRENLLSKARIPVERVVETLMMVQAVERAGDHATNLAEELVYLIEHRSIRHTQKRVLEA